MIKAITIDGLAGTGKSSVTSELGKRLSFYTVHSGLFYRVLTAQSLSENISFSSTSDLIRIAKKLESSFQKNVLVIHTPYKDCLYNNNVEEHLPHLAEVGEVREIINNHIRSQINHHNVIVEGRDAGSRIFPQADLKIYLSAPLHTRQKRVVQRSKVSAELVHLRDSFDQQKGSQIQIFEESLILDTSCLTIDTICEIIGQLVRDNESRKNR